MEMLRNTVGAVWDLERPGFMAFAVSKTRASPQHTLLYEKNTVGKPMVAISLSLQSLGLKDSLSGLFVCLFSALQIPE